MRAKKLFLSCLVGLLILSGLFELGFLLTGTKTEAVITRLRPGRRTTLADIRFRIKSTGEEVVGTVNAEHRRIGERIIVIYKEGDPAGTVSHYSPLRFLPPLAAFAGAWLLLYLIWVRMGKGI